MAATMIRLVSLTPRSQTKIQQRFRIKLVDIVMVTDGVRIWGLMYNLQTKVLNKFILDKDFLPSKVCFDKDRDDEEQEHESNPQVDDGPDGECESRRCDVQIVLVADVANCGLEDGADPGPGPGEGIEDRGQDEGGHCHEDQGDVERGMRGRRNVAFCDIAPCL